MPEPNDEIHFSAPPPPPEPINKIGVPIPMYDPANQISLNETDFTLAVNIERTRAIREMTQLTGTPRSVLGGDGLIWAIQNTHKDVGQHFQAHGIAKVPVEDLVTLMDKGLTSERTFYSMSFIDAGEAGGAFGADMPKTNGGIIVITDYDQAFPQEGDPKIKYIILSEEYMRAVDVIQAQYKDRGVLVVPWHDAPKVLTESYNEHNPDKTISYSSVSPTDIIRYPPKSNSLGSHVGRDEFILPPSVSSNVSSDTPDVW